MTPQEAVAERIGQAYEFLEAGDRMYAAQIAIEALSDAGYVIVDLDDYEEAKRNQQFLYQKLGIKS